MAEYRRGSQTGAVAEGKAQCEVQPRYRTPERLHGVGLAGKCVLSERHKGAGFINWAAHWAIFLIYVGPAVHAWEGRDRELPLARTAEGDEVCKALELL